MEYRDSAHKSTMHSLVSPWCSFEPGEVGSNSTRYAVEYRAYTQARGVLGLRNARNGGIGKVKGNAKKTGATSKSQQQNSALHADTDIGLSVCGKQEFPLPASLPYKESHLYQSRTSEASSGTATVHLGIPKDGLQLSRNAILGYHANNRAEPLKKILETTRKSTGDTEALGATPYRYKLSDLEHVANHIQEQSQEPPLSPWYPVFPWEKRLAEKVKLKHKIFNLEKSDPESDTDSCDTTITEEDILLEYETSVIIPAVDPDSADAMKEQGMIYKIFFIFLTIF